MSRNLYSFKILFVFAKNHVQIVKTPPFLLKQVCHLLNHLRITKSAI